MNLHDELSLCADIFFTAFTANMEENFYPPEKSYLPFRVFDNELGTMYNRWGIGRSIPIIGHILHIIIAMIYWLWIAPICLAISFFLNLFGIHSGPLTFGAWFFHVMTGRSIQRSVRSEAKSAFRYMKTSAYWIGPLFWY